MFTHQPPLLSIVGASGSGKTTLIEALLPWLRARGVRVAVLKHDSHGFQIDHAGKDTDRIFRAGARQVAIAGPEEIALRERVDEEEDARTLANRLFHSVDLVLTEGYNTGPWPKIEVLRQGAGDELRCRGDAHLKLVVTDRKDEFSVPALGLDDVQGVGEWVLREMVGHGA